MQIDWQAFPRSQAICDFAENWEWPRSSSLKVGRELCVLLDYLQIFNCMCRIHSVAGPRMAAQTLAGTIHSLELRGVVRLLLLRKMFRNLISCASLEVCVLLPQCVL